jgi:hypothetical protein
MYYNFNKTTKNCQNQINLINVFRKLWEQHVMWTRSFIISTAAELGDLDVVTERLLRNPTDFANVLKNFYGIENAKKFEALLKDHLLIAASLVNNAKKGDTAAALADRKKWYKNADEIAIFLSQLNPYWPMREFQRLFYNHLKMTEDEAVYRLNNKYNLDVAIFDSIVAQALKMADFMSYGIIEQLY